jgi:hypothetical protein
MKAGWPVGSVRYQDPSSNDQFNVLDYFASFADPSNATQVNNAALDSRGSIDRAKGRRVVGKWPRRVGDLNVGEERGVTLSRSEWPP